MEGVGIEGVGTQGVGIQGVAKPPAGLRLDLPAGVGEKSPGRGWQGPAMFSKPSLDTEEPRRRHRVEK